MNKHVLKSLLFILIGCFVLWAAAPAVMADPSDFQLRTEDDWRKAMDEGQIQPVLEWNEALRGLHPGMEESFQVPELKVVEHLFLVDEVGNENFHVDEDGNENVLNPNPGIIMWWPGEEGKHITAAWGWELPEDPDLTNHYVVLTAWPRSGMTSISFSFKDINGFMKGWRWDVGTDPGDLPPDFPTTLVIWSEGGFGEAGSTGFWENPFFDLTKVVSFEFDESGIAMGGITLPNNLGTFIGQWNYWHDIYVIPCPDPPPPPGPEHYTCYKVKEKSELEKEEVWLIHQFTDGEVVYGEVKKTKEICLPTQKNEERVYDWEHHLVCYEVKTKHKVRELVYVRNQFGEQKLEVKDKTNKFCVPSYKRVIEDGDEKDKDDKDDKIELD
jgi:hypothetical protein